MSRERVLGWLAVVIGLVLALAVQIHAPVVVPLYDGQPVVETYRYLHPTNGQRGNPTSATTTKDLNGTTSPVFALATEEQPPQAQIVVQENAFELPAGTTQLRASIEPVDPQAQPTGGRIAGNVYRFSVTGADGNGLVATTCDNCRTLVIRAPEDVTDGTVAHLESGAWVGVATLHGGVAGMFQANAPAMGDFAILVGNGPGGGGDSELDPLVFGGIALALFFAAVAGLFWYRRRPAPVPVARLGAGRGRVPSKRKAPRRPPSGRSGS